MFNYYRVISEETPEEHEARIAKMDKENICECGFKFEKEGFRNFDCYLRADGKWINICPKCKKEYHNG